MGTNIPVQLTRFIGRQREMADIKRLLAGTRLLTITGPGGSGKTRLAAEVARQLEDDYKDGIFWIDLVALTDETKVPQTIAGVVGILEQPGFSHEEALTEFIANKTLLLVLDNCEHLIAACAQLADALMRACPRLRIMVTSLEQLALSGEVTWLMPPLSMPVDEQFATTEASQYEAVMLFLDRALSVMPDFALTDENATVIGHICRRLDGMPLAIELAASRVNVLAVPQIANRLDDRFSLLMARERIAVQPRHQTLQATIDWSYSLLNVNERICLHRLAVFQSGCTLESAEAICAGGPIGEQDVLAILSSLVAKSLVIADTAVREHARYRLLETIRLYAFDRLAEAGEQRQLRDRHLRFFLELAERASPELVGANQHAWFTELAEEHDEFRAALSWALASEQIDTGLRIVVALSFGQFWNKQGALKEGLLWLERLLERTTESTPLPVHTIGAVHASLLAGMALDADASLKYGQLALRLAGTAGDATLLAYAHAGIFTAYRAAGNHELAYEFGEKTLALSRDAGDSHFVGMGLMSLAMEAIELGYYDTARRQLDESLANALEMGDQYRVGYTYQEMGELAYCQGEYGRALAAYEQSLSWFDQTDAELDAVRLLNNIGLTLLHLGDERGAKKRIEDSLSLNRKLGHRQGTILSLVGIAALAAAKEDFLSCARLLAAVAALTTTPIISLSPAVRLEYEQCLTLARVQMNARAFAHGQLEGRKMGLEDAIEFGQSLLEGELPEPTDLRESWSGLTARQQEVALLISKGKTNRKIADELVISVRTVEKHVANILAQLDLTNRSEITRWVLEHQLK
jgi:predicted ATPase/DNA-binding CsgD family transcriptional regulator